MKNFFKRLTADSVLGTEGESGGWQRGGCHLFLELSHLLDRLSSSKLVSSLNCFPPNCLFLNCLLLLYDLLLLVKPLHKSYLLYLKNKIKFNYFEFEMTSTNLSIKTSLRLIFAPENWNHIFKSNYEFFKILHPTSSSWPSQLRELTFKRDCVTRRILFLKAFYYKYVGTYFLYIR